MHLGMQTQSEQSAAAQTENRDGEERDLRDFAKNQPKNDLKKRKYQRSEKKDQAASS